MKPGCQGAKLKKAENPVKLNSEIENQEGNQNNPQLVQRDLHTKESFKSIQRERNIVLFNAYLKIEVLDVMP